MPAHTSWRQHGISMGRSRQLAMVAEEARRQTPWRRRQWPLVSRKPVTNAGTRYRYPAGTVPYNVPVLTGPVPYGILLYGTMRLPVHAGTGTLLTTVTPAWYRKAKATVSQRLQ